MCTSTQTLAGPSSKPSAKRADTTSSNTGKKRKTPVRASELASNGGEGWSIENRRILWWMRWRLIDGGNTDYRTIGEVVGRTATACRGEIFKLRHKYDKYGYEGTFGQPVPSGLGDPPTRQEEEDAVANRKKRAPSSNAANPPANGSKRTRLSKAGRARTTTEEQAAADSAERPPNLTPELRCAVQKMKHAQHHLRKRASREEGFQAETAGETANKSVEGPALDPVRYRSASSNGRNTDAVAAAIENNKTTVFADPKTQARVEWHREMMQRYFDDVPTQEVVDAAHTLMHMMSDSDGARLPPDPQFAAERREPQGNRMSVGYVMN